MLYTSTFLTLDGVMTDPQIWHPAYASEASIALLADHLESADGMLLGRRTNDEFVAYWPTQDDSVPLARRTKEIAKWVVTSSPGPLGWETATALEGDPIDAVRRLKAQGGEIMVPGSASLVDSLLRAELVDELRIYLDPVVVGRGRRFLADGLPAVELELVDDIALPRGVRYLAYRPVPSVRD